MDRFVLDTSVLRRLAERKHDVVPKLKELKDSGRRVELLGSQVQREELAAMEDEQRRAKLLELYNELCVEVPTGAFIWQVSNWGEGKWGDDEQIDAFDRDLRTPLTHYRSGSGEPLCGVTAASPTFAHGQQRATCWGCCTRRAEETDRDRGSRIPLTHYEGSSGESLCGDDDPTFADDDHSATCARCREERRQKTHRFRSRKTGDALITETAAVENAQYVAGDQDARNRARDHGLEPWDVDRFFAWVLDQS